MTRRVACEIAVVFALLNPSPFAANLHDLAPETPRRLKAMAEQFEADNNLDLAADTFERLLEVEPELHPIISAKLVRLYVELRTPSDAIKWARQAMPYSPDPAAYLAGVYGMVGRHQTARSMLEKEIARSTDRPRVVNLNWQLAELMERRDDREQARHYLEAAVQAAQGLPESAAAEKKLSRLLDSSDPPLDE